nr:immunoglobulin light chain junction region [Macaca mulatta]MOV73707.1 immunoglobulin light chain junction region [Macaca mulatta]MOW04163.1 immunoglobulin light chain junction region [Macaca mulatta]MOW04349.1 immunoglobulin light chain junction region [Macaca mulatta]MOW04443.1 immunoglobulin light chain junction region [Macaca mulatta]
DYYCVIWHNNAWVF